MTTLFVALVLLAIETRVEAAGDAIIKWEAPDDCPDEEEVRKAVALWLAQSVDVVDPGAIEVDARVKTHNNGYLLELSLETPSGRISQTLTAERCATLVDAVALNVALAATGPGTRSEVLEPVDKHKSDKMRFGARVSGGAAVKQLPGFAFTAALVGSLELKMWRVEAGFGYVAPRIAYYAGLPETDIGVELQLLFGTGCICARWVLNSVEIPTCIGVELGLMRGKGRAGDQAGVEETVISDQLWGALVLGPALRVPLGNGFSAWVEADALIALFRPEFQIRNLGTLYRPEAIAVRVLLGVEWQYR